MATEPSEMQKMVAACQCVYESMGGVGRVLVDEEIEQVQKMRRSMVTKIDLRKGDILQESSVEFKRPGIGISPSIFKKYIGREVNKDIAQGNIVYESDIM